MTPGRYDWVIHQVNYDPVTLTMTDEAGPALDFTGASALLTCGAGSLGPVLCTADLLPDHPGAGLITFPGSGRVVLTLDSEQTAALVLGKYGYDLFIGSGTHWQKHLAGFVSVVESRTNPLVAAEPDGTETPRWSASRLIEMAEVGAWQVPTPQYESTGLRRLTGGAIVWPDGSAGVFTVTHWDDVSGAPTGWTLTHTPTGRTVTQGEIAYDPRGNVTSKPALVLTEA